MLTARRILALVTLLAAALAAPLLLASQPVGEVLPAAPPASHVVSQLTELQNAVLSLPLATALGALLAFRPRRRGTPPRNAAVIQTQIILAIVGAVVMLVVGASLARAFGIVGAASLIRYRAKIDDPKDAGVMLSTLSIGLASGVGLHLLAVFSAAFILAALWVIESVEPEAHKVFTLKVATKDAMRLQRDVEEILRRTQTDFELRSSSPEEICYEVELPYEKGTDKISRAIQRIDDTGTIAVEWDQKKGKMKAA